MCDATFSFGQRGSHFLQCPTRREVLVRDSKLVKCEITNKLQAPVFLRNSHPSSPRLRSRKSIMSLSASRTATLSRGVITLVQTA